jgi:hypothetical protein
MVDSVQTKVTYLPHYKQTQIDLARAATNFFEAVGAQVDIMCEERKDPSAAVAARTRDDAVRVWAVHGCGARMRGGSGGEESCGVVSDRPTCRRLSAAHPVWLLFVVSHRWLVATVCVCVCVCVWVCVCMCLRVRVCPTRFSPFHQPA